MAAPIFKTGSNNPAFLMVQLAASQYETKMAQATEHTRTVQANAALTDDIGRFLVHLTSVTPDKCEMQTLKERINAKVPGAISADLSSEAAVQECRDALHHHVRQANTNTSHAQTQFQAIQQDAHIYVKLAGETCKQQQRLMENIARRMGQA